MYTFNINPMPKPRLVHSDKWSKRPIVNRYWAYKDELWTQARRMGYEIKNELNIVFYIPIPISWSKNKRKTIGLYHEQTPDLDNLIKGFLDCLTDDDSGIYQIQATKVWSPKGRIEVY